MRYCDVLCEIQCDSCYLCCVTAYDGVCKNGTLAEQSDRTQQDHCGTCEKGYELKYKVCVGFEGRCEGGYLIAQAERIQDDHCGGCNDGYVLDGMSCKGARVPQH